MVTRNGVFGAMCRVLIVAISMALSIPIASVKASTINVPDFSFENQAVPADPGYAAPDADTPWVGWMPANSGAALIALSSGSGVTGSQVGLLYCNNTSSPTDTSNAPVLFQVLTADVQAGKAYTLTVDVAKDSTSCGVAGDSVNMALAYRDGANNTIHLGADEIIPVGQISSSTMTPFTLTTGVIAANDPAVNNPLEIILGSTKNAGTALSVLFDNVQLSSVPEPGTLILAAVGLIGLLAYAWKKGR